MIWTVALWLMLAAAGFVVLMLMQLAALFVLHWVARRWWPAPKPIIVNADHIITFGWTDRPGTRRLYRHAVCSCEHFESITGDESVFYAKRHAAAVTGEKGTT